jgi:hypothetical protein
MKSRRSCAGQAAAAAAQRICLLLFLSYVSSGAVAETARPAAADAAAAAAPTPPRLPRDPLRWRYARGGEVEPPADASRFWDRQLLSHAVAAANYEQLRPLLRKLNAGRPITVAAIGSSVVQDHGGTFHGSLDAVWAAVPSPHPYLYGGVNSTAGGPAWVQTGWLAYFMRAVNETWPHPDHLLINAGRGGATPAAVANGMCVEASLPAAADLVVVENMGVVDAEVHEQIVWRLLQHFAGRPAAAAAAPVGSGGGASDAQSGGSSGSSSGAGRKKGQRLPGRAGRLAGRGLREDAPASPTSPPSSPPAGQAPGQQSSTQRPAVILFNTAYVAPPPWDCYYSFVPECCVSYAPQPRFDFRAGRTDAPHNTLADYYGFASISHRCGGWIDGLVGVIAFHQQLAVG